MTLHKAVGETQKRMPVGVIELDTEIHEDEFSY